MNQTIVILAVGLTPEMIGKNTPNLNKLIQRGKLYPLTTITPAVTCSVQATFMTGKMPSEHGIVGNGWLCPKTKEVRFWQQARDLMNAETVWEEAKRINPDFTSARMFWCYNMYGQNDFSATPRPQYPADGRKIPDIWTEPSELRDELQDRLGQFPLFHFWGPTADIKSSKWITDSSLHVYEKYNPTLTMVYLPHLDYNLQRLGPEHPDTSKDIRELDEVMAPLLQKAESDNARVMVLSEYGITQAGNPVHINRALRKAGLIRVRNEQTGEFADPAGSKAFAVVDHQVAHIYVNDKSCMDQVKTLLENLDGVETILDENGKREYGLNSMRSGDLVAISKADHWFTYYYWSDDAKAPDYARTVDIHRKPGYDPVELFINPKLPFPMLQAAWRLFKRKLGFRTLMDLIGLDATPVQGSHGRITDNPQQGPLFITTHPELVENENVHATHIKDLMLKHIFD